MKNLNPLFLIENNQTITNPKHNAYQFGRRYWKSGKKDFDSQNGVYHIYRTIKNKDGSTKVKRIKKNYKVENNEDNKNDKKDTKNKKDSEN